MASGTLFFHFKRKEDLIHELYQEVLRKIENRFQKDSLECMPLKERLLGILANIVRYFLDHPAEFLFVEQYHFSPFNNQGGSLPEENQTQTVRSLLLQAREEKVVRNLPLLCLEAVAFGPIVSLIKEHTFRGTRVDENLIRLTVEASWNGLRS